MVSIAICDNVITDMKNECSLISKYQESRLDLDIKLCYFYSSQELLNDLKENNSFQIYILDHLLDGVSGLEVGKQIRMNDKDAVIIYVSNSKTYAFEAFLVWAQQFLLKPVKEEILFPVLDYALTKVGNNNAQHVNVKTKDGIITIPLHTIVYVECIKHVLYFHLTNNTVLSSIHIRVSFESAADSLLKDRRFSHPHKSYIVNMDHIKTMLSSDFVAWDNTVIPISRKKFPMIKNQYMSFIAKKKNAILLPPASYEKLK